MTAQPGVVAGVFRSEEAAAQAVKRLVQEHFDPELDLSVIVSHGHERREVAVGETHQVGRGAAIGAAVGAVLAGVGVALAGVDFGPITLTAAGPVVAALEAAYMGGCVGFSLGALMGIDITRLETGLDPKCADDCVVWVGVHATGARASRARELLAGAGARHFMFAAA